jgi:transcriptional regulator with XRE-family HTH domain
MTINQVVGANLKQARQDKGYTQTQVAQIIGQVYQAYAKYESGRIQLSYELIVVLCKLLDVSPNYLFGFDEYGNGGKNNFVHSFNNNKGRIDIK